MTQMMQVIYFSCITDHMWVNRYVPIQQESLCNIYIRNLKLYCNHTQHHNFGKSRPIRHAIWLFWGSHGFPHRFTLCIASLTLMMTSMSTTIDLLQQMWILPTLGTCCNCSSPTGAYKSEGLNNYFRCANCKNKQSLLQNTNTVGMG